MHPADKGLLVRNRGRLFLFCVFFGFFQAGLFAGHSSHDLDLDTIPEPEHKWISAVDAKDVPENVLTQHPIPKLMTDAETNFRKLLSKQSRSLKGAVKEYKKRYRRDPPKGFDRWWKFAVDNDVKMIDEYDGLVADLAPFWEISAEELRRRAAQVRLV